MTDWHRGTIQKDFPGVMVVCSFKDEMILERTFKGNIKKWVRREERMDQGLSIVRKNAMSQVKRQG